MSKLILLSLLLSFGVARADVDDGTYLDPKYTFKHPPLVNNNSANGDADGLSRNDVEGVIALQTPIKSQERRGTCSIFSATAILESMLIRNFGESPSIDLSEEWLEYAVMRDVGSEGSGSSRNFSYLATYGSPSEAELPYIGDTWDSINFNSLAYYRCSLQSGFALQACLLGHRAPYLMTLNDADLQSVDSELYYARASALILKTKYLASISNQSTEYLGNVADIKKHLANKIPVTLDIDFYYGAWNHSKATTLGIPRNSEHWKLGIVGHPAIGSVDRQISPGTPAGHSIVVVGYDDNVEVTIPTLMTNGTTQNLKYKGVYYFKNSWGTDNFALNFTINGHSYPGYGMITQQYAHEFGSFFRMPLGQ